MQVKDTKTITEAAEKAHIQHMLSARLSSGKSTHSAHVERSLKQRKSAHSAHVERLAANKISVVIFICLF